MNVFNNNYVFCLLLGLLDKITSYGCDTPGLAEEVQHPAGRPSLLQGILGHENVVVKGKILYFSITIS